MSERPSEETQVHTRLMKCALEIEDSRAFWARADMGDSVSPVAAFEGYWFGARSLPRIVVLLTNMRARYMVYPNAMYALHRWPHMTPETRRVLCHWHLQLSDPLYRAFTGTWMVERRESIRPAVTLDVVVAWVGQHGPGRWTMSTRIQFGSKLLSSAYSAGLVGSNRDPRPLALPRVPDEALEYMLYLLRETEFAGTLLDNPYLRSVGLQGRDLEDRVRMLPGLEFRRQGDLLDIGWRYASLRDWADARDGNVTGSWAGGNA
jgi:hypothetical protein